MADVRSMLKAERANRRITHPDASYTSDNQLQCKMCETLVKSDAAWQAHLHSMSHTLRVSRQLERGGREFTPASNGNGNGKKRKANGNLDVEEERKKARPDTDLAASDHTWPEEPEKLAGLAAMARGKNAPAPGNGKEMDSQSSEFVMGQSLAAAQSQLLHHPVDESGPGQNVASPPQWPKGGGSVDESELAAFERELAEMERSTDSALNAQATISAAPRTADGNAAQAQEQQTAQRGKRDADTEGEREDAAIAMQDEFDQMEGLEARLRKLRERREALRKSRVEGDKKNKGAVAVEVNGAAESAGLPPTNGNDDGEEIDDWGFDFT
ncbi:hypothetical protein LTR53_005801 [Teratosphaeriaceae sp. CCFEE 6253]|nr:hypothetical protein LTR53_005801 [Teratosphaeriaceae sp. CCFEE 6253]